MPDLKKLGDLEISQDMDFQRRMWTVQRVSWGIMALTLVAAVLGLFGPGLLNNVVAGSKAAPLWLEYKRFGRFQAPTTLRIHLGKGAGRNGKVRVLLNRDYLNGMQIQQITPQPESVEAGAKDLTYVFQVPESNQRTAVTFYLQTQQIGPLSGQVRLFEEQSLHFSQFIYP